MGPVAEAVEELKNMAIEPTAISLRSLPSDSEDSKPLKIGIIGFGAFGQFLASRLSKKHIVSCIDQVDKVSLAVMLPEISCPVDESYPHSTQISQQRPKRLESTIINISKCPTF